VGESLDTAITYTIDDGNGGTDTATVTMTVTGVNDTPVAQNDAITTDENTVYSGSVFVNNGNGADSDIDTSDVITVTAIAGGTVGAPTAGSAGGQFTLSDFKYLAVGESLDTAITYTIDDGNGGTDTATVTMTVTGVNDTPVAQNDLALINDDSTIVTGNVMLDNGNGADSDVDTTDILTITGVSGGSVGAPTAGSAGGLFTINSDGSYTFDPNGDFAYLAIGETQNTTVTYTLNDGNGGTDTATVTVTVTGLNDAFTGNTDNITINENALLSLHATLLANDTDIDLNDILDIIAVDISATNGTVVFNNGSNILTYSADNFESLAVGETASDSFTYTVTDGHGDTQDVTVNITVNGVNDGPVAQDDVGTINENSNYSTNVLNDNGNGADSDIDTSDILTVSGVTGGSVGVAKAGSNGGLFTINSNGSMTFNTNGNFESLAVGETRDTSVTYTVSDGHGGTDTATVTMTVTGVNDAPIGNADTLAIDENIISNNLYSLVLSNDTDVDTSDVLTISAINTSSTTGYVTFNSIAKILTYSAQNFDYLAEGATATDSFVYTVSDGNGGTSNVTVNITITGVNDDPNARDDLLTTNENTIYNGNVLSNNGNGADSDADTGDVITVSGIVGGSLGVALAGSAGGLFTVLADGSITFDPNGEFRYLAVGESAQTILYYNLADGYGGESVGTVTMTVTGTNDIPIAQDDAFATSEDTILTGNVLVDNGNGIDSDYDTSDVLTVSGVTGGSVGAAVAGSTGGLFTINADGSLTFDPNGDFKSLGTGETLDTTITYTVSDGHGGTDTASITVTVTGLNDAPTAEDDAITINADTTFDGSVLADNGNGADFDPDTNDVLTVIAVAGGSVGVAVAGSTGGLFTINADGTFNFDPNGEFDHLASDQIQDTTITYTISDGNGETDTATITMTVTGGSIVANDDGLYGELAENGNTIIISEADLMANDTDVVGLTIDIVAMSADPGQGSLLDNGDGTWTYTSPADSLGFLGEANITYTLQDNLGLTDTATFQLRVFNTITGTAGNDTMIAENNSVPHKFIGLAGNDTITGSNVRDLLIGGADNDTMYGGGGDDDFIFEGTGNGVDSVDGGGGTDRIIGSSSDDTFSVFIFTNIEEINMGAGTDILLGTTGNDTIIFGTTIITDLDQIDGNGGTDIISGTTGDDNYDLSNITLISNIAYIDLGAGNDTLRGSKNSDTILISAGNNNLSGDDGDDIFLLNASATGVNNIDGGNGYDQILGGSGNDFLISSSLTSIEYIDLGTGTNNFMAEIDGTLDISAYTLGVDLVNLQYITDNTGTETVTGTNQNDEIHIRSDANADTFNGLDGDDTFIFSGTVNGGDIVDGGNGNDQILGSAGDDALTLSAIISVELIDMGAGNDYIRAAVNGTLDLSSYTLGVDLLNLEYITDNTGTETVTGTNQNDEILIRSDANADTFNGLDGDDTFTFSGTVNGGDLVDGGNGNDQILGSAGDDSLALSSIISVELIDMGAGTDYIRAAVNGTLDLSSYTLGVDLLNLEYITDNTASETVIATNQSNNIIIQTDAYADAFYGLDGDDTFIFAGAVSGGDLVDGGNGNDQLIGSAGDDGLTVSSIISVELIDMGAGNDYIRAAVNGTLDLSSYTLGVDLLNLEYITDNTSSETVTGTNQNDYIVMQADWYSDTFNGLDGDDIFSFSGTVNQNDTINGGAGNNQIIGSAGNDTLQLASLINIQSIDFGDGNDAFVIRAGMTPGGTIIDMGAGTDYIMAQLNNTLDIAAYTLGVDLLGLEYITDNIGSEVVIGTNQNDEIHMQSDAYSDAFYGLDGDDTFIFSGLVNRGDIINGGNGYDRIIGSAGNDTLLLNGLISIEFIDLGAGTNKISSGNGGSLDLSAYTLGVDLLGLGLITDNIRGETVIGTNQADEIHLTDDAYKDFFRGLDGDDTFILEGNLNRNDDLDGGTGYDRLIGTAGNDEVILSRLVSIEYIDLGAGTDYMRANSGGSLNLSAYTVGTTLLGLEYISDNITSETITGTNQNDEIHMQSDVYTDTFNGLDGDDTFIFSGDLNQNDNINGGNGYDSLLGSAGNDTLVLNTMSSIEFIDLGAGTDYIMARSGGTLNISAYTLGVDLLGLEYIRDNITSETITGTNQNDEIHMQSDLYTDTFYGLDGDDTFIFSGNLNQNDNIDGGNGYDSLLGSAGNDTLVLNTMSSIEFIDLGAGTDYIMARSGGTLDISAYTLGVDLLGLEYIRDNTAIETVIGTNQNDEIHMQADASADTFNGLDGDDTFIVSGAVNGGDIINGGNGYDRIIGSAGNDILTLSTFTSIEFIDMGAGTDYMRANSGGSLNLSAYTIGTTLLGLEYIIDNTGIETVTGTNQNDEIHMQADTSADTFNGLDGDDTFIVSGAVNGGDIINGGNGTNQVIGSTGNDTLRLASFANISSFNFGDGNDTFLIHSGMNFTGVVVDMGAGTDTLMAQSGMTLDISAYTLGVDFINLEYISDNTAIETVIGTNQNDTFVIQADASADTFNGLDGDDTFIVSGAVNGGDIINGGNGNDQLIGSSDDDGLVFGSLTSIEYIDMGTGIDYIMAKSGSTLDLSGYTRGVNLMNLEYITDNTGTETVIGTAQNDLIYLQSDSNTDTLYGGAGADTFYINDNLNATDILADYNASEGDIIDIADILQFDSGLGDDISDFVRLTDSGDGNPANGSGTVTLEIDVDGTLNGSVFQSYVVFSDQAINLATLIANGSLIVE